MADAPETVTDAVALLAEQGFTDDVELADGRLHWGRDDDAASCAVSDAEVERVFRFEGPSDPGDMMIVLALRDPATGRKGSLATAYGPAAEPGIAEHVANLASRWHGA